MCKKVAVLAESFHVPAIPHGYIGLPLAGWFQASLAMGSEYQEVTMVSPPLLPQEQWAPGLKVLKSNRMFEFENGEIIAPQLPGLGLDIDEEDLCIGIGISSGDVSFGEFGHSHRDLTAIGTVVNTAARAQSAARAGQILVTKTVRDRCDKDIVRGDGSSYNLKGLAAPVELYDAGG